jgi:hypothetical protein
MKPMARFIVILLIALLPLRGWSAVGMSVNMAATGMTGMASHEMSGHEAMPEDCPMMRMAGATDQRPKNCITPASPVSCA